MDAIHGGHVLAPDEWWRWTTQAGPKDEAAKQVPLHTAAT